MLEKKIADKLKNHEIDPQDGAFFEKIMQERGKRNAKSGFLLMGSIAVMFLLITGFSVSKFWGKLPADGFTKEQVVQIKAAEAAARDSAIAAHDAVRAQKSKQLSDELAIASEQNDVTDIVDLSSNQQANTVASSVKPSVKKTLTNKVSQPNLINSPTKEAINPKLDKATRPSEKSNLPKTIQTIDPASLNVPLLRKRAASLVELDFTKRFLKPLNVNPELDMVSDYSSITLAPSKGTDSKDGKKTTDNKNFIPYKFWPRELNFYAGTFYNQRFINENNDPYAKKINELEKVTNTNLIGMNAEYHLKKSIFAQLGFQWMTIQSSIQAQSIQSIKHSQHTILDPGGSSQIIDIYDTSYTQALGGSNTNNYFEIPITFGARWQINKHIIQPQIGVVTAFYGKSRGLGISANGETASISNKQDRFSKVNAQALTGFTYTYLFAQRLGVYVNPNLRYSLTNHTKTSYAFSQYNSMIGVQVGVKYILK